MCICKTSEPLRHASCQQAIEATHRIVENGWGCHTTSGNEREERRNYQCDELYPRHGLLCFVSRSTDQYLCIGRRKQAELAMVACRKWQLACGAPLTLWLVPPMPKSCPSESRAVAPSETFRHQPPKSSSLLGASTATANLPCLDYDLCGDSRPCNCRARRRPQPLEHHSQHAVPSR